MTKETKWAIDAAHSSMSFKVRHLMIAYVSGFFKTFEASIYTDGENFRTAEVNLWVDVSSIQTGNSKRDEHLKSNEFFDIKNHKQIQFTSSGIGKSGSNGVQELWGELTMMGITKNIKLVVRLGGMMKDQEGNQKAGFTISGTINRSDWGLVWNTALENGGLMVGDEVTILCELELLNATQANSTMILENNSTKLVVS